MRNWRLLRITLAGLWVVVFGLLSDPRLAFGQASTSKQTVQGAPPRAATRPSGPTINPEKEPSASITDLPPTWIIYRFYFAHLLDLDRAADEQEKLGNEAAAEGWRVHEQRAAALTDEEIAALREVAAECNDIVERPSEGDREAIVQAYIDRLRQRLGRATFERLSRHVQGTFRRDVTLIPPAERIDSLDRRLNSESVSALATGPSISVASHVTLNGLQARAMCQATMNNLTEIDPLTNQLIYPSVAPYCRLVHGTAKADVQCALGNPTASCSETVTVVAGEQVHAEGFHYLNLSRSYTCTYTYGDFYPLLDKYHFGAYGTDPSPEYPETGEVPTHSNPICTNFAALVAHTTGQTVTAVEVSILPLGQEVLPGLTQQFTWKVNPSTADQNVTWSIDKKVGTSDLSAGGLFTAPKNDEAEFTQTATFTVKACSTATPSACASTSFSVPKVSIEILGTTPALLATASATRALNAIVHGPYASPPVTWLPASTGSLDPTGSSAVYTAPAPAIKDPAQVPIKVCLNTVPAIVPPICGASNLDLVPPVTITGITPTSWAAGSHDPTPSSVSLTINGSGFGTNPSVSVSDGIGFTPTAAATNTQILGKVAIPLMSTKGITVTVSSNSSAGLSSATNSSVTVTGPTVSVGITQTQKAVTLREAESLQFTLQTVSCKTSGAGSPPCSEIPIVRWTANKGTIDPITGVYKATASIVAQTTDSVSVCAVWAPTIAACDTATVTLVPINVTVSPTSATLIGCDSKQFSAQVTGNTVTTVNWSNPSVGTIDAQGLYKAPCPFTGPSTSVTIKATSTVDAARFGQATVTLLVCGVKAAAPTSPPADFIWSDDDPGQIMSPTWIWDTAQAASGTRSNTDARNSALHEHSLEDSFADWVVGTGNYLTTYVLIDPCDVPDEILLEWKDQNGSWEHRAFWGSDKIARGTLGTPSRLSLGALPAAGQWVRLSVKAGTVGLDGQAVGGIRFSLYGGKAWFDRVGFSGNIHRVLPPGIGAVCCFSPKPHGSTVGGTPVTITGSSFVAGASVSFGGVRSSSAVVISATQISAVTPPHAPGLVDLVVTNPDGGIATAPGAFTYALPTISSIGPTNGPMAGGTPITIAGNDFASGARVWIGGAAAAGVVVVSASQINAVTPAHACGSSDVVVTNLDGFSATSTGGFFYTSPQPPTGLTPNGITLIGTTSATLSWAAVAGATQYAVRVQDNTDGTLRDGRNNCASPTVYLCVDGVTTTTYSVPVQTGHSYTWWVHAGSSCGQYSAPTLAAFSVSCLASVSAPAPDSLESIWVDDQLPAGAIARDVWIWDTAQKASGSQSHNQPGQAGAHQHYFDSATSPLVVGVNDKLVAYVLLDPCDPPQEVMLQWWDPVGGWEHRAFWGPDLLPWGAHVSIGPLPASGQWVKLSVPASAVGLGGASVYGMAFTLSGGHAWFDRAGVARAPIDDAIFVGQTSPPACMFPGSTAAVAVTMKNTGNTVWDSTYRLGSQNPQDNGTWGTGRVFLANGETIAPGQSKTFTFNAVMPTTSGTYNFQWRMVHEGVQWFGGFTPNATSANTAPFAPTGLAPNGSTLPAGSVTLSWNPTPGATQYAVRVQDNTDGTVRDSRNNCLGVYLCVDGVVTTSYSVPVVAGHSYTWWVHAGNCAAYGAQTIATFNVTAPGPPPSPTGLSPNGVSLTPGTTSLSLSWSPTPGATKYAVRLQDNTDGSIRDARNNCPTNTIYVCVDGVTATSFPVTVLPGHSYSWWVHAGNNYGYSAQTNASFSVPVAPLHGPTGLYKDPASANLIWTPPDNLTAADQVTYDLWIYGGPSCASGCLFHPGAPSWYTMGASISTGSYSWTLKANSVSRPSSPAVSGGSFTMP